MLSGGSRRPLQPRHALALSGGPRGCRGGKALQCLILPVSAATDLTVELFVLPSAPTAASARTATDVVGEHRAADLLESIRGSSPHPESNEVVGPTPDTSRSS